MNDESGDARGVQTICISQASIGDCLAVDNGNHTTDFVPLRYASLPPCPSPRAGALQTLAITISYRHKNFSLLDPLARLIFLLSVVASMSLVGHLFVIRPAGLQKKQPTTFVVDFGSIRIRFDWM